MALILSIDTSTRGCSVALHRGNELLACNEIYTDKSSSAMLTTLIKNVVEQAGHHISELDAVAVAKGPGSYTGLRIAVSTAKGLCFALEKPMLSVNTLEAMALQMTAFFPRHLLCPMIDARRMEVFCAVFDPNLKEIESISAKIIDEHSFEELLANKKIVFFGDGANKCQAVLGQNANAVFPTLTLFPSAKTVGYLAFQKYNQDNFEDLETFEPFYLKEFVGTSKKSG